MAGVRGWRYVPCGYPAARASRHLPVSLLSGRHHHRHPPCEQGLTAVVQSGGRRLSAVSQPSRSRLSHFFPKIKVDLISIIHHERKKKKTYYGPNDANRRLGRVVRELARLWKRAVLLGFVCVVVAVGVGLDGVGVVVKASGTLLGAVDDVWRWLGSEGRGGDGQC
jgi:hypothetical protein